MILNAALCQLHVICAVSVLLFLVSTAVKKEDDDDRTYQVYDYGVKPHSSMTSLSRSPASVSDADLAQRRRAVTWRWCYVCSGKSPDRQCELFPQHVTLGPAKVNCTKNYCTSYVRYKPKDYLIKRDRSGEHVGRETLTPDDYEVASVARECEDADRGNECMVDADELGATCYSSCTSHYCNDETRRPTWQDLLRRRVSRTRPSKSSADRPPPSDTASDDPEDSRLPDTLDRAGPGLGVRHVMKDIDLYQPADWNSVVGGGGGSYDMPSDVMIVNTSHHSSVNTLLDFVAAGNSTMTSSTSPCDRCSSRLVVTNCFVAFLLLIISPDLP